MAKKKPEDELDDFLAAPETLLKNKAELQKAVIRKAKEKARKEQLRRSKFKTPPTVEDMLADIVRVASDKQTNPWYQFRSISRQRYVLFGHYPIEFVDQEFGQFYHALQVAGLRDQPGDRVWRANRAMTSRGEHTKRYINRHVRPYVVKQSEFRELHSPYLLLSISDTHSGFLSPFVWHSFLRAIKDLKPDGVLFNGDTLEGGSISSHKKIPGWAMDIQTEFDFHREMVRQVRAVGHEGDFFVNGGNHGIDRWAAYMTQVSPEMIGLRSNRIDKQLGLDEFNVKLYQGGTVMSPEGTEEDEQGFLMFGFYRPHHGTKLGKNPAASELASIGRSGQSGHVHRADLAFGCTEADKGLSWMCTPMGCTERVTRGWLKSPNKGWQMGFGVAWLYPDGDVHQYPVICDRDRCTIEGHIYTRPEGLSDPNPNELWLPDLPLPA